MTSACPPRVATWMLGHLTPGESDEALAGDLLECFRAGRSGAWYWRQVLMAIVIRWIGSLLRHWPVLLFAAAWATLSPAWQLLIMRLHDTGNLIGPIWLLPWPWSMVCAQVLSVVETLAFVWTGIFIYLLMLLGVLGVRLQWRIRRALVGSIAGYLLAFLCEILIAFMVVPLMDGHFAHAVNWRTLTLSGAITNFALPSILMRLPYLIATACALWGALPSEKSPMKLAE
jgi:hypothetical protein